MSKAEYHVAPRVDLHYNLRFKCETMIAYLSGKLLEKQANTVILDVGGVGYEVSIPLSTFYELGEVGSDVQLRIYTHVREDAIQLFGFKTNRERELYLRLLSVQGIGAKSGITMLSGMSADEIIMAIRTDDLARLTSIPGVGRRFVLHGIESKGEVVLVNDVDAVVKRSVNGAKWHIRKNTAPLLAIIGVHAPLSLKNTHHGRVDVQRRRVVLGEKSILGACGEYCCEDECAD